MLAALRKDSPGLPFDIADFHVYGGDADTMGFRGRGSIAKYLDWCRDQIDTTMSDLKLEGMPVWYTEFDYPAAIENQTDDPDYHQGGESQTDFVRDFFGRLVQGRPDGKVFWASLLDDYDDDGFQSTGLVNSDKDHHVGKPHQAYTALRNLLTQ